MEIEQAAQPELPARPEGAAPPPNPDALSHEERIRELYPNDPPNEEREIEEAEVEPPTIIKTGDYELTAPDGFEIAPDMLKEAAPIFRDLGISNEGANKLMPLGAKLIERHEDAKLDEFESMT